MKTKFRLISLAAVFGLLLLAVLAALSAGARPTHAALTLLVDPATGGPASAVSPPCAPGPHSGTIEADEAWCIGNSPHLITGDVVVFPGVTLMIQEGVVVKTRNVAELQVRGHLSAIGTADQRIFFTSEQDTGPGEWHGLYFNGGTGDLEHVVVRYAGPGNSDGYRGNIVARNVLTGELRILNSEIRDQYLYDYVDTGLNVVDSHVLVSNTLFTGNGGGVESARDAPMRISGASSVVTMTDNSFIDNVHDQVFLSPNAMMGQDASLKAQTILEGYLLDGDYVVPQGITLTVDPGVTVISPYNVELEIQGHLNAIGTPAQPITFKPQFGEWQGIYFNGGTGDLQHVTVRDGNGASSGGLRGNIVAKNVLTGEVRISDSVISDHSSRGLNILDSHVVVSDTLFTRNGGVPLWIGGANSVVTMTANSFVGNNVDRTYIEPGAMTANDIHLGSQTVMEGYLFTGDYVVPPGITLTVDPGVTVMSPYNVELQIQGHLNAIGTPAQPITFTPQFEKNEWEGIYFNGGTGDLRHVTVHYGNGATSGGLRGNIVAQNVLTGEVRISDSVISDHRSRGLNILDSHVVVSNTLFTRNGGVPLRIEGANSVVTMTANSFVGNNVDQTYIEPGAMTANDIRLRSQTVMDGYLLDGDYVVPPGITLTVDPGVTVRSPYNVELQIQGHLNAIGAPAQPITFGPQFGEWEGIYFNGGTGDLRHATVRYSNGANSGGLRGNIVAQNVPPGGLQIAQSALRSSSYYALMVRDSHVTLDDSAVTNNGSYSVYIDGSSTVTMSESLLQSNRDGMFIGGDAHVNGDRLAIENNRYGVVIDGNTAVFTLTKSAIVLNTSDGVRNSGNAQVTLGGAEGQGNTIMANGGYGAYQVGTGTQMVATHNWWGDISGPYHPTLNPQGKGNKVSDRVLFDPWAVEAQGTVPVGVYVAVGGPRTAPPGGNAAYTVLYHNGRTEAIADAVLELQLPARATFLSASHDGIYWPQRHEVVWRLGNLAPGASGLVAVQTRYTWGLSNGTLYAVQARLGAPDLPLGLSGPQDYLDLEVPVLTGMTALTSAQFDAERAAHPELEALYTAAIAAGFVNGGAVRLDLETGAPITQAVLIHPTQGEVRYVRRQGDQALAATFAAQTYTAQTPESSLTVDWRTDAVTFTGMWGSGEHSTPAGDAYAACRFTQLPGPILDEKATLLAQTFASATCYPCRNGGACAACGAALHHALPLPEAVESLNCLADAKRTAMAAPLSAVQNDPPDEVEVTCYRGWTDYWYGRPWVARYQGFDPATGLPYKQVETVICDPGQSCKAGTGMLSEVLSKTGEVGCVCKDKSTSQAQTHSVSPLDGRMSDSSVCSAIEGEGVSRCQRTEIFLPRDPNAKYGLEGDLVPGQFVTYTITYENEGAGRAYGVFITDKLDAAFDPATLVIQGPGQFIAANRTLLWDIGELGPKGDPDSQGEVSFTVQLRADTPIGTAVVNQAVVFFPTVGEETPTNPVINSVRPLAAVPQRLETGYMQPVEVNLAGREPNDLPLNYRIIDEPLNGALSGTLPNLTYTPAENFTGLERFTFSVNNGAIESLPAEVLIEVSSGDADTIPPQVIWASPVDGTEVPFRVTAVLTDEAGPVFAPILQAQFSEALDPDSISGQTVHLVADGGGVIPLSVVYDPRASHVALLPRAALRGGVWYTASLTTGITDLAGNPLAADYVWRFRTAQTISHIYLPLVLRQH